MPISDIPDDVPDDVRDWLAEDYDEEVWERATIHGDSDGNWSVEIFYDDGTSESIALGVFDEGPDDWVWELYDWLDYEVEGDVEVEYE